jgi:hypothetical protein
MKNITTTTDKYILCHDGIDIIHCILLKEGNNLSTGLEFVEEFVTKEEVKTRVNELTNDENYFDSNFPELV